MIVATQATVCLILGLEDMPATGSTLSAFSLEVGSATVLLLKVVTWTNFAKEITQEIIDVESGVMNELCKK